MAERVNVSCAHKTYRSFKATLLETCSSGRLPAGLLHQVVFICMRLGVTKISKIRRSVWCIKPMNLRKFQAVDI